LFEQTQSVTVLTGVVFGLAPALQAARADLSEVLNEGGAKGAGSGAARSPLRNALIVSEVALSLVLLVGAGLLVRSFLSLQTVSPGFDARGVLTMYVFLPGAKYPEEAQHADFFERAAERLRSLPGVEAVGLTSNLPVSGNYDRLSLYVEEHPPASREDVPEAERYMVNADYFRAMGVTLLEGRTFGPHDRADAPPVAVVNELAARRHWPGESAVGKRIRTDPEKPWMTVVGVVSDVRHYGLETAANAQLYLPHLQSPSQVMTFAVRGAGPPEQQAAAARAEIWSVDKDQPVYNVRSMEGLLAGSLSERRFTALLLGVFAALALFLAAVGIYGVISYLITQRTREIGIRIALGAQGRDVLRLVLGQGLAPALAGVALGLAGAAALSRLMSGLLYGVSAADPLTFAGVSLLLSGVAFLACYIPARRATRVDPLVALRHE